MSRGARNQNKAIGAVLKEAEQNLLSAFEKSKETLHGGSKGNARAKSIADFLEKRLPFGYGVRCQGEVVDYLDNRSPEMDILIYDKVRNSVLSEEPLWVPAESVLAYIEVKSVLSEDELKRTFAAAKAFDSLRPFKKFFTLTGSGLEGTHDKTDHAQHAEPQDLLRCFRTLFAYGTNLSVEDWLNKEWRRILKAAKEVNCSPESIDRILILDPRDDQCTLANGYG